MEKSIGELVVNIVKGNIKEDNMEDASKILDVTIRNGTSAQIEYLVKESWVNIKYHPFYLNEPLYTAASLSQADIVEYLLQSGINVVEYYNQMEENKILDIAVKKGYYNIVEILIKYGANVNNYDNYNCMAPLNIAVERGYYDIVELLLKNGAKMTDISSAVIESPIHIACRIGNLDIVKLLVKHGADVNYYMYEYITPLYQATKFNHLEVVKFLVENGAFKNMTIAHDPLQLATKRGYTDIAKYLKNEEKLIKKQRIK